MRHRQKVDPDRLESRSSAQPRYTKSAFIDIGEGQRGAPESVMLKAKRAMGIYGVLPVSIEDAGDIVHRANQINSFGYGQNAGYVDVKQKVDVLLNRLKDPGLFEHRYRAELVLNAKRDGDDPVQYQKNADKALLKYGRAHSKLRSLNESHRVMKKLCVALARQDFAEAKAQLLKLNEHLGSSEEWKRYAHEGLIEDGS